MYISMIILFFFNKGNGSETETSTASERSPSIVSKASYLSGTESETSHVSHMAMTPYGKTLLNKQGGNYHTKNVPILLNNSHYPLSNFQNNRVMVMNQNNSNNNHHQSSQNSIGIAIPFPTNSSSIHAVKERVPKISFSNVSHDYITSRDMIKNLEIASTANDIDWEVVRLYCNVIMLASKLLHFQNDKVLIHNLGVSVTKALYIDSNSSKFLENLRTCDDVNQMMQTTIVNNNSNNIKLNQTSSSLSINGNDANGSTNQLSRIITSYSIKKSKSLPILQDTWGNNSNSNNNKIIEDGGLLRCRSPGDNGIASTFVYNSSNNNNNNKNRTNDNGEFNLFSDGSFLYPPPQKKNNSTYDNVFNKSTLRLALALSQHLFTTQHTINCDSSTIESENSSSMSSSSLSSSLSRSSPYGGHNNHVNKRHISAAPLLNEFDWYVLY